MPRNDWIVRVLRLARILADSKRGLPLKTLSERHGWTLRTLYRDIEALEAAGFAVIHEDDRFRLPSGALSTPPDRLQPEERLALFSARQIVGGLRETATGRALDRLWQRLSGERPGTPLLLATDAPPALSVRSTLSIDYGAHRRAIATIEAALAEGRALSCRYEALSTGELTARVVEPGTLHWDAKLEALYLIGWCRLRNAVRVFAVHRFRMISLLNERVQRRAECKAAALKNAFNVWRGGNVEHVAVKLSGWAAREALERNLHPSQRVQRLPRGEVRVELEVAGLEEVTRWILGFGALAQAEKPALLVERVRQELLNAARAYSAERSGARSVTRADRI